MAAHPSLHRAPRLNARAGSREKRGQSAFEFLLLVTGAVLFVILAVTVVRTALNTNSNAANNTAGGYQDFLTIRSERVLYSDAVKADCVGGWQFSEGTGTTTVDASGNGNTGTLFNTPTWTTGKKAYGIAFNGLTDHVAASDANLSSGTSSRTVSLWFKTTNSSNAMLVFYGTQAANQAVYVLLYGGGTFTASQHGSSISSPLTYVDGAWHHGVVTYDSSTWSVYVDGQLKNSGTMTTSTTLGGNLTIAKASGGQPYFNGTIDEVAVYNRSLTADEIAGMYGAKEFWCS